MPKVEEAVSRLPAESALRSRVLSSSAARSAATASSSRAVPLSRWPSVWSALPKSTCVAAQASGTRSRVYSSSAARKAPTACSRRAVPLSRARSVASAMPRLVWVAAQASEPDLEAVLPVPRDRPRPPPRGAPSHSPAGRAFGAHCRNPPASPPRRAEPARVCIPPAPRERPPPPAPGAPSHSPARGASRAQCRDWSGSPPRRANPISRLFFQCRAIGPDRLLEARCPALPLAERPAGEVRATRGPARCSPGAGHMRSTAGLLSPIRRAVHRSGRCRSVAVLFAVVWTYATRPVSDL